jgi:hypothetical protein
VTVQADNVFKLASKLTMELSVDTVGTALYAYAPSIYLQSSVTTLSVLDTLSVMTRSVLVIGSDVMTLSSGATLNIVGTSALYLRSESVASLSAANTLSLISSSISIAAPSYMELSSTATLAIYSQSVLVKTDSMGISASNAISVTAGTTMALSAMTSITMESASITMGGVGSLSVSYVSTAQGYNFFPIATHTITISALLIGATPAMEVVTGTGPWAGAIISFTRSGPGQDYGYMEAYWLGSSFMTTAAANEQVILTSFRGDPPVISSAEGDYGTLQLGSSITGAGEVKVHTVPTVSSATSTSYNCASGSCGFQIQFFIVR